MSLTRNIEALLFLSSEPLTPGALADACEADADQVQEVLERLRGDLESHERGLVLRELAGGWVLSTHPASDEAARRLLSKPRTPPLSAAQAETLAIVAYLQPVSRPEIARIRGVSAESATQTLLERGLVEEAGRSQFGANLYRSTDLFLKLFGLESIRQLPDVSAFDPSPELQEELRDRLLRAGEARLGETRAPAGRDPDWPAPHTAEERDAVEAPEPAAEAVPEPAVEAVPEPAAEAPDR
jgi:segregation and condensation protein B